MPVHAQAALYCQGGAVAQCCPSGLKMCVQCGKVQIVAFLSEVEQT
jgi:hypothetical protein